MTIDEAIEHAEWAAENSEGECSNEHRQLAEWLRQVREANKAARRHTERNSLLEVENDKLREERDMYRDLVGNMVHPDIPDQLYAENTKLRELVRRYGEYTDQDRCEGCVCKSRCNEGDVEECWQLTEIRELSRELGVEAE